MDSIFGVQPDGHCIKIQGGHATHHTLPCQRHGNTHYYRPVTLEASIANQATDIQAILPGQIMAQSINRHSGNLSWPNHGPIQETCASSPQTHLGIVEILQAHNIKTHSGNAPATSNLAEPSSLPDSPSCSAFHSLVPLCVLLGVHLLRTLLHALHSGESVMGDMCESVMLYR